MKLYLKINAHGKLIPKSKSGVRKSLDYHFIPRRPLNSTVIYHTDIDVSAVILNKSTGTKVS